MSGRQRFSIIPAAAVTDRRLEPRDLQVLCLLGRHTDNLGWCRRSQVVMAKELGCGRATLHRSLLRLRDAGYLEWRVEHRASGADSAHSYRVVLDVPEEVADQASVVPTSGHHEDGAGGAHQRAGGVPTLDGQGVPTHERAPMLTTPLNDQVERDARERATSPSEGEVPDPDLLDQIERTHPDSAHADREAVEEAWRALTPDERRAAAAGIGPWLAAKDGKHRLGLVKYLRQKRWAKLAAAAPPAPGRPVQVFVERGTPQWDAWQARGSTPCDTSRPKAGWWFPTEWPDNHQRLQKSASDATRPRQNSTHWLSPPVAPGAPH